MADGSGYRGRGPRLGLLDRDRGGNAPRPGLSGHHSGHPPGRGHPPAGPTTPAPRQGHGPTASGGAPLPQAAARHGGPLTCPVARVQAAQGPLREVLRWLERPAQGPGVLPRAWTALRRRLGRLRALGPEYADFEPGGAPDRLAPLASLRRLSAALAGRVRATLRAEDKDRVREWRAWLEESWSSD